MPAAPSRAGGRLLVLMSLLGSLPRPRSRPLKPPWLLAGLGVGGRWLWSQVTGECSTGVRRSWRLRTRASPVGALWSLRMPPPGRYSFQELVPWSSLPLSTAASFAPQLQLTRRPSCRHGWSVSKDKVALWSAAECESCCLCLRGNCVVCASESSFTAVASSGISLFKEDQLRIFGIF